MISLSFRTPLYNRGRPCLRNASLVLLIILAASTAMSQSQLGMASEQPESKTLSAKEILEKVLKTYANCKSYRDSGTAKYDSKYGSEYAFNTDFVRPDRFRFELRMYNRKRETIHVVIWRNGDKFLFSGPEVGGVDKPDSLTKGMVSVAGLSSLMAHSVPLLLLPKEIVLDSTLAKIITDPERIDDAKAGKIECFRITGKFVEQPRTIWIDKNTFLIRRIDTKWKLKKGSRDDTVIYDPEIDVKIPEEMLKFERKEK